MALQLASSVFERPRVHGKFFFRGKQKYFIKGISYGPFKPNSAAEPFPEPEMASTDFSMMREIGVNTIRVYNLPPQWLLNLAASKGLMILVGIPWAQHVCFLDDSKIMAEIKRTVRSGVESCKRHPAAFGYLVGNEIPSPIVRWHGHRRIERFLKELYAIAKSSDPEGLVTYANYPPTEYLNLDFVDFVSFNVYLHRHEDFRRYAMRLHNLANDKPLVVTELGIDSIRHGRSAQADFLSTQLRLGFELGLAGTVAYTWTDEWYTGGYQITDWGFGVVDSDRKPKDAYSVVKDVYGKPIPSLTTTPKISVVVATYNGRRTIRECLQSLTELNYPNYEVILVDDGSTDGVAEIARKEFPQCKTISQPHQGLAAARNTGIDAADGEIAAFTDSDCVADPDWLGYIVLEFAASEFVGVGGPNLPPPSNSWLPASIAAAPGAASHVLLDDEVAEHIPGCNMAYRKSALQMVSGFDPIFKVAGDDVDVCWRLQDFGFRLGFSPSAVVWHHRRNTIKAYLKQQEGYGKAEALLSKKHPSRFSGLHPKWRGRIYAQDNSAPTRSLIQYGVFGTGYFQRIYEEPYDSLAYLPISAQWKIGAFASGIVSLIYFPMLYASLLCLTPSLWSAARTAFKAKLRAQFDSVKSRTVLMCLVFVQPIVRDMARLWFRIKPTA